MPITGDPVLDNLSVEVARQNSVMSGDNTAARWLMNAVLQLSDEGIGLVISLAVSPVTASTILYVSPRALALLDYASQATYASALAAGTLIVAGDVQITNEHVAHFDTSAYDIRFNKGTTGQRRLRVKGGTLAMGGRNLRITLLSVPP